jgi:hypothetical protein
MKKLPTIQQDVDIVNAYNKARENELRTMPTAGFPTTYKNDLMDRLYDAAAAAAGRLSPAQAVDLDIGTRK